MPNLRARHRRIAVVLDAVAAVLVVASGLAMREGGFVIDNGWIYLSLRTPGRVMGWLGIAFLLRLVIDRQTGPFGLRIGEGDQADRDADDVLARTPEAISWRRTAIAGAGIGIALVLLLHEQLTHPYSVPDLGDPLFSVWRLAWVSHQLVTNPAHLFDANIFYPQPLTLTYSDPIILPALMAAPLLAVGIHPLIVYNLLLLSGFWLSGVATYVLVERLVGSPRAAFVAGLIYACYAYRFDHYSHFELQMTQWMPLALLALHLFVSTGRWPYAFALALAGVAQLYSSMYYAVFFLVYAAVIGAGLWMVHRTRVGLLWRPLAIAGVMAAIIALPVARAFVAAEPTKGERGIGEITYYSAQPSDYLRAQKYSWLWRNRLRPPLPERTLFPGAAPLALAAAGLAPPLGAVPIVYAAGLVVAFEGSLGFNGGLYPYLHRWLSPFRGIRAPARYAAIVGLTLAILAGFGARRILRHCRSRAWENAVWAGLLAVVLIDAWPVLGLQPVWKEPPDIYRVLQYTPAVVLAEFPMRDNEVDNLPFMYFSQWHWLPMVNGYSGFIPKSYLDLHAQLANFPDGAAIDTLRKRGVNYVSVNCGLNFEGCGELMAAMRHSARLRLAADTRWNNGDVQLYEVLSP